jgi:signal transduction histidine kinase
MAPTSPTEASVDDNHRHSSAGALSLLSLFSSTLLSTNRLNKLLHLFLSALVHQDNNLFGRAMLFLHNEKTGVLQGMLGVEQLDAAGLQVVGGDPANPLTGHWELDDGQIAHQWRSDYCTAVRSLRIELGDEGCRVVAQALHQRQLTHVTDINCQNCAECGFIKRFTISSFAAAPLISRNRTLGVVIVDVPGANHTLTNERLQLLQLFASQAGMAIDNSQLYRNLEEAHAELRESRQRLVHSAHLAAIGEMAASISHELKTPLVTIGGFAARLRKLMPDSMTEQQCLDTIISETQRLELMLADILAYSRKPTICYNRCDLRAVLQECLDDYASSLAERSIELKASLPPGYWEVLGDAHQLKQVCINLLVNAQEAMRQGGVLRVVLDTLEQGDQDYARITIEDTGGGIPEEDLSKVFAPFFTTKNHGTGLGLPIVSRIVQNHGGSMRASNGSRGAIFTVQLPLADSQDVE